jgi:hypothetical protein
MVDEVHARNDDPFGLSFCVERSEAEWKRRIYVCLLPFSRSRGRGLSLSPCGRGQGEGSPFLVNAVFLFVVVVVVVGHCEGALSPVVIQKLICLCRFYGRKHLNVYRERPLTEFALQTILSLKWRWNNGNDKMENSI